MALNKKPVTGMKDIMPEEMEIRDYVIALIKETYKSFGFTPMETPAMESIENLSSKQGGENEKLIFKVMKRGEKLKLEEAKTPDDLVDAGMRYDLTVPLVRYYSNHANELPKPFKALQIGPVWRADRPQKGRFRQFYQCDIDILGEPTNLAEIECITATTTLLGKLGFQNFRVHINDRRILKAMAALSGFAEADYDKVFIILDKMDKIGVDGVKAELLESGFAPEAVEKYGQIFDGLNAAEDRLAYVGDLLENKEAVDSLKEITASVEAVKAVPFELMFDPTLVRGMSYYTGTIFEIEIDGLNCSCGGGGRYDEMVGRFTNLQTPACGFSIGFERIITILLDQGFKVPGSRDRIAFLVEKNLPSEKLCEVMKEAAALREKGHQVLVNVMAKNKKFQKDQLQTEGYADIREVFAR
ncbi:MAG: histidine--tRNA ligase [Lachnospiraceae bacterium]|nr:histidine--tRNA ligase [Lachnospiraceae bacterium]